MGVISHWNDNQNYTTITAKGRVVMDKRRKNIPALRCQEGKTAQTDDPVAVEEPLEIFLDGNPYYLTMRLPGEEIYLALGYCFSEGIIDSMYDVLSVNYCKEETGNRINVMLDPGRREARVCVN